MEESAGTIGEVRDISYEQAEKEIQAYLEQHPNASIADLAWELWIDIDVIIKIVNEE